MKAQISCGKVVASELPNDNRAAGDPMLLRQWMGRGLGVPG